MNIVDEPIETIHLYVVREEEKRPYTVFPLFCAFLCLVGIAALTLYSAQHPYYERARLIVPATFLPLKVFIAEVPIIPTGVKTYPATYAQGTLTLTNGSVLSEVLPSGVIFRATNGIEVQTEEPTFIPAGSASGYGTAYASARAFTPGKSGNIQTLAVNAVYGTTLYIRNMNPFIGGKDGFTVTFATAQDKQTALTTARSRLVLAANNGFHYPCSESYLQKAFVNTVTWRCQFATYKVPSYMHVLEAKLAGRDFLVTVEFIPMLQKIWVK